MQVGLLQGVRIQSVKKYKKNIDFNYYAFQASVLYFAFFKI